MKYMLMMNTMKAGNSALIWSKEDGQRMVRFMKTLDQQLRETGELVFEEGLSFPDQAKLVVAGDHGQPVMDGAFPESKEFLAGFWIVEVATPDRAYEIAAKISICPGPGGMPLKMPIEVRPIPGGPPPEFQ